MTLRSHIHRALDVLAKAGLDIRPIWRPILARVRSRAEMARWLAENPIGKVIDSRDTGFSSPAISITMVFRNRAHCIGDAIRSVQAQSFADWELIVIDDGSTDGTRDTVARFARDPRIRYVWQPPQGMAKARNHSLPLTRGALIAYLDDDNLFIPISWPRRSTPFPASRMSIVSTVRSWPTFVQMEHRAFRATISIASGWSGRISSTWE